MEKISPNVHKFCQLLTCFDCDLVPLDLFRRACRPKPKWSSDGDFVRTTPEQAAVPPWLCDVWDSNAPFHETPDALSAAQEFGLVHFVTKNCISYVRVAEDHRAQIHHEIGPEHRRTLLFECTAIAIHAFPCKFAELLGEEMEHRLIGVIESCILPLLAVATDADILSWLSPKEE